MRVRFAVSNGSPALNGDATHKPAPSDANFERIQIVNDEKQFTWVPSCDTSAPAHYSEL